MNDASATQTDLRDELSLKDQTSINPEALIEHGEIFVLDYKTGPMLKSLNFREKDLRSAIDRAKIFCIRMRYRFIYVKPFITDLDSEEVRMAERNA